MVVANNKINATTKNRQIDDDFDDHGYAAVQRGVHSPIEQKMAQAQQIWSIILQHHEST